MDGGVKLSENAAIRGWPRDTISRLEDLEVALDAAARVNRHLNAEAQALVSELRRAQRERDAWQRHAQHLARCLAAERRRRAGAASEAAGPRHRQQQAGDGDEAAAAELEVSGSGRGQEQGEQQQQQQQGGRPRRRPSAGELDADGEAEAAALSKLPPAAAAAAAGAPPPRYDWPGAAAAAAAVSALVSKGRAAGWLVAPGEVELGPLLGAGAFGETHKGRWRGADVAVKRVRIGSETELVSFLREIECLAGLRHPGIVPFLGAVVQGAGHCWLLAEFMSGGNMASYIHGGKTGAQFGPEPGHAHTLVDRLQRALEIAGALAALEACAPPVLHRDVKPSNIFIDGAGRARLGDFGLARLLPASAAALTGETGTYLYMAPEMIRHEVYDSKADVWSFGVMLAEVITCQIPYQHTYMTPVQIAMAVADEQLQPVLPASLPASLLVVAHACCDFDPDMRPAFKTVVEELSSAIEEIRAAEAAAAARGSLLERLKVSGAVPASWVSVLGQLAGHVGAS